MRRPPTKGEGSIPHVARGLFMMSPDNFLEVADTGVLAHRRPRVFRVPRCTKTPKFPHV